ncbi:MAG: D-alanine--D-alanine ligase [Flavobacteriales bacterium]|nr:D-alanine--D-alanine ligase [Flavobacteriales bacterium]
MKKKIAVVTGGFSGEAEISLKSAETVLSHIDREKYEPYKTIILKNKWLVEYQGREYPIDKNDFSVTIDGTKISFDGVFVILHGTPGEDGKLQGYFDMIGLPYTSCGATTSALTFNKAITNRLLSTYDINVAKSVVSYRENPTTANIILEKIGTPCFVKPNNGGSSIGISKVNTSDQLAGALEKAFHEDSEIIIEQFLEGTEITCGVISQNNEPKALAITEIVCESEFFDFEAKYNDHATQEITPARIDDTRYQECLKLSEFIYETLQCKGMIRIDYMISNDKLFVIEVNTIPGLTAASLLPQHAEHSGISTKELFTNAIEAMF